jgi:outer membrane protein
MFKTDQFCRTAACAALFLSLAPPPRAPAADFAAKLTLKDCLKIAEDHNPTLHGARFSVDAQAQTLVQTQSARYPQVSLSALVNRLQSDDTTDRIVTNFDTYSPLAVSASMPVYDFGRIRRQIDISRKDLESARINLELQKALIAFQVKQDYFNALRVSFALTITESSLRTRRRFVPMIQQAYERGARSKFDLARAETDYESAKLSEVSAIAVFETSKKQLLTDMGTPDTDWKILDDSIEKDIAKPDQDVALRMAVNLRPELRSARVFIESQEYRTRLAWDQNLPSINLASSYNINKQTSPTFLNTNSWQAGLSATIGLFSGFATQATYKSEIARLAVARQKYLTAEQRVELDVRAAFIALHAAVDRIRGSRRLLKSAGESLDLAVNQFERGRGSIFDLTDAQNQALNARLNLNDSFAEYRIAEAALERAVGADIKEMELP